MVFRLAVVIALLIGLGDLFHFYTMTPVLLDVHIVAGLMVLIAVAWMAWQVKSAVVGLAALLLLLGGLVPLVLHPMTLAIGLFHLLVMLVAIGLAEMGVARSRRATA